MGRGRAVWAAALVLANAGSGAAGGPDYRRLQGEGQLDTLVRSAVEGARRRLQTEECRRVLDEFHDAAGRPLRANLDALGLTPAQYLDFLVFYDGQGAGRCRASQVLATTWPGSRVVFVCGDQFVRGWRVDRWHAEVVVIHEALHTLGLGENPPSSRDITARVLERCGG